jgi:hypothetical protein
MIQILLRKKQAMNLLETIEKVGKDIAASQMFSCKNEAQGRVIALSCLTTGRDILSVPEEYHLMNGKLSLQATAMLGRLVKRGGTYEVLEHSPNKCSIKITYKGREFTETITWEDAQEEPFVYAGKTSDVLATLAAGPEARKHLVLSANYATPRRRMQHLWARVVSDSVRVVAPDLVTGSYTPEEVADFSGLVTPEIVTLNRPVWSNDNQRVLSGDELAKTHPVANKTFQADKEKVAEPVVDPVSTPDQITEIKRLIAELELPEETQEKSFAKRGCTGPEGLTQSQAAEMIVGLVERLAAKTAAQPKETGEVSMNVNGPITAEYEKQLRNKIAELAQTSGEGLDVTNRIKAKLKESGLKMRDMRHGDARNLMRELEAAEISDFFTAQLLPAESVVGESDGGSS